MRTKRPRLILQATGSEAALLRVIGHGTGAGFETLARARSARRERDAAALSDESVLAALRSRVAELKLAGNPVVLVLGNAAVSSHRVLLPRLEREAAHKAIRLKLASVLHYDVAQASFAVDSPRNHKEVAGARYRVAVIETSAARAFCQAVESIGLRVSTLHAAANAIENLAAAECAGETGPVAIAYVAESSTTLVVMDGADVVLSTELAPALNDLTTALMRPIIDGERSIELNEAQARGLRDEHGIPALGTTLQTLSIPAERIRPLIEPVLQQWGRLFTQWLTFASTADGAAAARELRIIGPGAAIPNLASAMEGRVPVPVRSAEAPGPSISAGEFGPAWGVVNSTAALPDLLPPEIRSRRHVELGARLSALCGPAIAAGLLVMTFLLSRAGVGLTPALAAQQTALHKIETQLADQQFWETEAERVARMQRDIDSFSTGVPRWTGVFKELARLLPTQLVVRQIEARSDAEGMELMLSARVDAIGGEKEFDALIRDSLLALQASCFFDGVEIVSASRIAGRDEHGRQYGIIEIRGRLVYAGASLEPAHPRKASP